MILYVKLLVKAVNPLNMTKRGPIQRSPRACWITPFIGSDGFWFGFGCSVLANFRPGIGTDGFNFSNKICLKIKLKLFY